MSTPPTPTLSPIPALPPPTPELAPAPALPSVQPSVFKPRCSIRSNFGKPPGVLVPLGHVITQYTDANDHYYQHHPIPL